MTIRQALPHPTRESAIARSARALAVVLLVAVVLALALLGVMLPSAEAALAAFPPGFIGEPTPNLPAGA